MESFWAELSIALDSEDIIKVFIQRGGLNIVDLKDSKACANLKIGKLLGSGLNGKIYQINDKDNQGLEVVVKNVTLQESVIKNKEVIIIHETLCEIIMSAYFNRLYSRANSYSVNFPYFQGFFSCGSQAQIVMEKLDVSLYDYLYRNEFKFSVFTGLLFQLTFSLLLLRKEGIMHNHLHTRNLMLVSTKDKKYKSIDLNADFLYYKSGEATFKIPNSGYLLKFVDFDFSARHKAPKVCPKKLWTRPMDVYNVQYEWRPDYDLMIIVAFLIDALFMKKALSAELDKARILLEDWIGDLMGDSKTIKRAKGYHIKKFMSNFNPTVNRPIRGKEFMGLQLKLDYWNGKYGIEKISKQKVPLVGDL